MIIICIVLVSCKKSTGKNGGCRIVTATEEVAGTTYIYNVSYNNEGKIAAMVTSGGSTLTRVFTYKGNTIIVDATFSGTFFYRDSITLNDRGKMINERRFYNTAGTNWTNLAMEYNGDVLLKYNKNTSSSLPIETTLITVTDGNTTKVQGPSSTINYEYWTDKNIQQGEYLEFFAVLELGVNLYPHKNLLKTIDFGGGNTHNFTYEFNPDGQISTVTNINGTFTNVVTYQYQCN